MHSCHDSSLMFDLSNYIGLSNDLVFITSIILTGIFGSFTHCIGMCGPIAMLQTSMRMMNIDTQSMKQSKKFSAALAMPYYLGKATTYTFYYLLLELLTEGFRHLNMYKYGISVFLLLSGAAFIWLAASKNFSFFITQSTTQSKNSSINKIIAKLNLKPFGLSGYIMGLILGLIPCGFVYVVITAVASYVDNIALGAITILMFGISTIPGLFLISYFGNYLIKRYKRVFAITLRSLAFFNALLLFGYAFSLLNIFQ